MATTGTPAYALQQKKYLLLVGEWQKPVENKCLPNPCQARKQGRNFRSRRDVWSFFFFKPRSRLESMITPLLGWLNHKTALFAHYPSAQHRIAHLLICSWLIWRISGIRRTESPPSFCSLRYKLYCILYILLYSIVLLYSTFSFKPLFKGGLCPESVLYNNFVPVFLFPAWAVSVCMVSFWFPFFLMDVMAAVPLHGSSCAVAWLQLFNASQAGIALFGCSR